MPMIAAIGQPYGLDMASQSIDFYIGLVRLFALATLALCFCSDELRRVASFGSSAVLLLGIACGLASYACLCGSFFRGLARAHLYTDCQIVSATVLTHTTAVTRKRFRSAIACRL